MIVVHYTYDPDRQDIHDIRPAHREYLGKLFEEGNLLASGPLGENAERALLIFPSTNPEAVEKLLADDPFVESGIASYDIQPWTVVYGPWD